MSGTCLVLSTRDFKRASLEFDSVLEIKGFTTRGFKCSFDLMALRTSYVIRVACFFRLSYVTCAACFFLACEQALLFGQAKRASRERVSEGPRKGELATISHKFSFPPRKPRDSAKRENCHRKSTAD